MGVPNLRSRLHSCHAQEGGPWSPQRTCGGIGGGGDKTKQQRLLRHIIRLILLPPQQKKTILILTIHQRLFQLWLQSTEHSSQDDSVPIRTISNPLISLIQLCQLDRKNAANVPLEFTSKTFSGTLPLCNAIKNGALLILTRNVNATLWLCHGPRTTTAV